MKAKWYVCTLLIVFTLLGTFHENISLPNQEIVLEFNDVEIAKEEVESTITDIKKRLIDAGASSIRVNKTKNSTLKITYYSGINVANIKQVLSKKGSLIANNTKENKDKSNFPSQREPSNYNIDVYELNNDINISNFDNKSLLEIKYDPQRYTTTKTHVSIENILKNQDNKLFKIAFNLNKNLSIFKSCKPQNKQEVRAGPVYFYI